MSIDVFVRNVRPDVFLQPLYREDVYIAERVPDNSSISFHAYEAVKEQHGLYRITRMLSHLSDEEIDAAFDAECKTWRRGTNNPSVSHGDEE